jgi:hypothetical protein
LNRQCAPTAGAHVASTGLSSEPGREIVLRTLSGASSHGKQIGEASYQEMQQVLTRLPSRATVRLGVLRDGQMVELSPSKS